MDAVAVHGRCVHDRCVHGRVFMIGGVCSWLLCLWPLRSLAYPKRPWLRQWPAVCDVPSRCPQSHATTQPARANTRACSPPTLQVDSTSSAPDAGPGWTKVWDTASSAVHYHHQQRGVTLPSVEAVRADEIAQHAAKVRRQPRGWVGQGGGWCGDWWLGFGFRLDWSSGWGFHLC